MNCKVCVYKGWLGQNGTNFKTFFLIKIQTYGNSDWIGSLKSATLTKILTCGFKQAPKLNNTSTSINLFIQKFIHKFNLVYIFLFFFFLKKPTYWECMGATLNFGKNTISTFLHTWFRITEYLWIHMQEKLKLFNWSALGGLHWSRESNMSSDGLFHSPSWNMIHDEI